MFVTGPNGAGNRTLLKRLPASCPPVSGNIAMPDWR